MNETAPTSPYGIQDAVSHCVGGPIPPRYSVSKVVDILKSNTSRALRAKFGFLDKVYWDRGGIWAKGFFVSTVGINEEIIKRYVQMQGAEDAGQAELEL